MTDMDKETVLRLVKDGEYRLLNDYVYVGSHTVVDAQVLVGLFELAAAYGAEQEREACAVASWTHYMDACKKRGVPPVLYQDFCAADAIRARGEKK